MTSIKVQCFASIASSLAGIIDGMTHAWSTVVTPMLQDPGTPDSLLTDDQISWIMSAQGLGAIVGPIITWIAVDRIGRTPTMLISIIPMIASYAIMVIQTDYLFLLIGRILGGVGITMAASSVPLYIGEVVEDRIRGAMNATTTICSSLGQLLVLVVGPYLTFRWLNIMCVISALVVFFTMLFIPESPYYYVIKNDIEKANKSLKSLRSTSKVEVELKLIIDYVEKRKRQKTSTFDLFTNQANRRAFLILLMVPFIHIWSASQGIQTYAYNIFEDAGYKSSLHMLIAIMAMVLVIASVAGLFTLDFFGRRTILFFSSTVMLFWLIINGIFYTLKTQNYDVSKFALVPVIATMGYIAIVKFGIHNLAMILLSEYFSTNMKAKAAMLSTILAAGCSAATVKIFEVLVSAISLGPLFFVLCIPIIIFSTILFFVMPETKCRSLEDIEDMHSTACSDAPDTDVSCIELNSR